MFCITGDLSYGRTWLLLKYHLFTARFMLTFKISDNECTSLPAVIPRIFCLRFPYVVHASLIPYAVNVRDIISSFLIISY